VVRRANSSGCRLAKTPDRVASMNDRPEFRSACIHAFQRANCALTCWIADTFSSAPARRRPGRNYRRWRVPRSSRPLWRTVSSAKDTFLGKFAKSKAAGLGRYPRHLQSGCTTKVPDRFVLALCVRTALRTKRECSRPSPAFWQGEVHLLWKYLLLDKES